MESLKSINMSCNLIEALPTSIVGLKGITEDQVKEWRKEGRFFLRKFAPGASIPSMILEDE